MDLKHDYFIDYLRVICTFSVILIHVIYQSVLNFSYENNNYLILFNALLFAVPNFIMITGYLQLAENKVFKQKKCIVKVLLPLIFWGIMFSFIEYVFKYRCVDINILYYAIGNVIFGTSWAHLWYLYMIISLYLIIPLIKMVLERISQKYLVIIMIVLVFFNSFICDLEKIFCFNFYFELPVTSIYIFYLLFGYYVRKYVIKVKSIYLIILWIVSIALILISCLFDFRFDSVKYNNLPVVVFSCTIFLTIYNFKYLIDENRIINFISSKSFGIYLLHMIYINFIYKFILFNPFNYNYTLMWFLLSVIVGLLSLLSVFIIKKIPIMKKFV